MNKDSLIVSGKVLRPLGISSNNDSSPRKEITIKASCLPFKQRKKSGFSTKEQHLAFQEPQ